MADNFTYTPGAGESGGADDIGGVKYARVKVIHGADGVNDGDVASGNPLPVTEAALNAVLGTTAGAAVVTDANGAIQQYLRGIVTRFVSGAGAWVNIITGQSGITAGAGAVAANTPRVTHAS